MVRTTNTEVGKGASKGASNAILKTIVCYIVYIISRCIMIRNQQWYHIELTWTSLSVVR